MQGLVEEVLSAGGDDNITIVLAHTKRCARCPHMRTDEPGGGMAHSGNTNPNSQPLSFLPITSQYGLSVGES